MTARISLCMIVRDEAEFIVECIESAREAQGLAAVLRTSMRDAMRRFD